MPQFSDFQKCDICVCLTPPWPIEHGRLIDAKKPATYITFLKFECTRYFEGKKRYVFVTGNMDGRCKAVKLG